MIVDLGSGASIEVDTDDPEKARRIIESSLGGIGSLAGIEGAESTSEGFFDWVGSKAGEAAMTIGDVVVRGPAAGAVKMVEGVATLAATPIELLLDDPGYTDRVREFYEKITPKVYTQGGQFAKLITQFAVPGTVAARIAKAKNLGKTAEVAALMGADFAVATQDVESFLGDFFDIEPMKATKTQDLEGIEKATAEIGNRLKVAAEGAALILGIPPLLRGTGKLGIVAMDGAASSKTMQKLAKTQAAKYIRETESPLKFLDRPEDLESPSMIRRAIQKANNQRKKWFTFQGEMPFRELADIKATQVTAFNAIDNLMSKEFDQIDRSFRILAKSGAVNKGLQDDTIEALNNSLFSPKDAIRDNAIAALKTLDDTIGGLAAGRISLAGTKHVSLAEASQNIRKLIDDQSKLLTSAERGLLDKKLHTQLMAQITAQQQYYGTRAYRMLHDVDYKPPPGSFNNAKTELKEALLDTGNYDLVERGVKRVDEVALEKDAIDILDQLRSRTTFDSAGMETRMQFDDDVIRAAGQGPLKGRTLDNLPAIREWMGEYTGDADVFMRTKQADGTFAKVQTGKRGFEERKEGLLTKVKETIEGQAKLLTKAQYFRGITGFNDLLPAEQKFLKTANEVGETGDIQGWTKIGGDSDAERLKFGPLADKWAKTEHVRAFQDVPTALQSLAQNKLYATFLGLKGMSQSVKTIYSPPTQVRNATTAAFFAIANGNLGKGKELLESALTVFNDVFDKYKFAERIGPEGKLVSKIKPGKLKAELDAEYQEYLNFGVVNTGARKGEWEQLMREASEASLLGSTKLGKDAMRFIKGRRDSFANKLYQGSDDIWKIYSYKMENGRLKSAIKTAAKDGRQLSIPATDAQNILEFGRGANIGALTGDNLTLALKREAAAIVRDTVPNYARVPAAIQALRRLPLGNFIAFPAELIRTSGNILTRATKELASASPEIRSIGMRRLVGLSAVHFGLNTGLYNMGLWLTGSDREQVDAYKRSFAAPWDRHSELIPIASDKNGNPTEFYNFSYTNPYDYMRRPITALWNTVNQGIDNEEEMLSIVYDALNESVGEFLSPFASESMITQKMLDVARNQTEFGRPVWNEADPASMKWGKSLSHLLESLTPGISPIEIRAGADSPLGGGLFYLDIKAKDFPKAVGLAFGADPTTNRKRTGERLDAIGTMVEALSGVKTIKPQIENTLFYRGIEASQQVREAARIFNRVARSRDAKSAEDITKAYVLSNEQRFKALRDLSMAVEDARLLGISDADIVAPLKRAKTPKYQAIMNGTFVPFFPSKETIAEAQLARRNKVSNPIDMGLISQAYAQQMQRRFPDLTPARGMSPSPPPPSPPVAPRLSLFEPPPAAQQPAAPTQGAQALRQAEINKLLGIHGP